ncbi:DUF3017 domain-containing protein [Brachybacterium hainanense]|uniref:DUF3017 domain-containing protein n=1 Tax=Brachybacterium hainanense TaxID=1541174 RepID=A0ABV6RIS6_9MICO
MTTPRSPYTLRAALRRQTVLVLALLALAVVVAVGASGRAPLAGLLLALLLGVLALLRAVAPTAVVGALAVRGRVTDVAVLGLLAAGVAVVSGAPNL